MHAVTYEHNSCPPNASGTSFRERSEGFGTKKLFKVRVILDGGSFLDGH